MAAKCPKCEKIFTYTKFEPMETRNGGNAYHGVAYKCPFCSTILSYQMDPIALNTDLIKKIKGH